MASKGEKDWSKDSKLTSPIPQSLKSIKDEEIITNVSSFIRNNQLISEQRDAIRRRPDQSQSTSRWPSGRDPLTAIESMSSINLNSPPIDGVRSIEKNGAFMEQLSIQESRVEAIKKSILKTHFSDFRSSSRSIFAMICITYAFYQMGVTTTTYFEYKTSVAVKEEDIVSLKGSLPGITVCNKNLIEKSAAFSYMSGFEDAIKFQLGDAYKEDARAEDEAVLRSDPIKWKKLIEVYEDFMSTYYAEMSVSRQLKDGPDMEKFLKHLACNKKGWPEWDPVKGELAPSKFECQKKGWINTAQGKGNCITLFHQVTVPQFFSNY